MLNKFTHLNHLRRELSGLIQEAFRVWKVEGTQAVADRTYWTLRAHGRTVLAQLGIGARPYGYKEWIADNEPTPHELAQQKTDSAHLSVRPLFSIITPVYNPPPTVFEETVQSVLSQSYDRWELWMVDGGSDSASVQEMLSQCEQMDPRIRLIQLEENLGISGNSNVALESVSGDFVALLDHDDLLAPNMLYEVASTLSNLSAEDHDSALSSSGSVSPVDIIYFDEDKISADSLVRRAPWFKPDFAPDTLLANNILMHCVIRRSLLQEIGGFDSQMDGAQDWDVALRCSERTDRIIHIPKVLYHWRQIEGSAALDANAKPWAYDAQARCISAHLARLGASDAQVSFPNLGQVRIQWPTQNALISIIILNKDKAGLIRACVTSILEKSTYPSYEIIIVDTGSTDAETLDFYESLESDRQSALQSGLCSKPRVQIVNKHGRFNFSAANNFGASHANGSLLLFLNNDTEVLEPTWLEEMCGWAMREHTAIVGTKLVRPDKTIQHGGIIMGLMGHGAHVYDGGREQSYGIFGSTEWYRNVQAVTGACVMVKRSVFDELSGFDETYEIGFNDIDLCLRAGSLGYRVVYTPFARLLHHEGSSRGFYLPPGDLIRATLQMWPIIKGGDPNFNINLSYLNRLPDFARPNEQRRDQRLLYVLQTFRLAPWAAGFESEHDNLFHDEQGPLPVPPHWSREQNRVSTTHANGTPRRLLLVSHDLSLSGAPLMLFQLARYLVNQGYQIEVVSPLPGGLASLYSEANIDLKIIPNLLADVRMGARVVAGSDTGPYELVLANTVVSWQMVHVARAYHVPSLLWVHESEYGRNLALEYRRYADTLAHASKVVFPTQLTADLYRAFLDDNSVVIPYGLSIPDRLPTIAQQKNRETPKAVTVLTIGSIEPRKGQDILMKAIHLLPSDLHAGVQFRFVGRITDKRFGRVLTKESSKLQNVVISGEVGHAEAMAMLAEADLFLLPSQDEVLPVTVLEAMQMGKPIIATEVGGLSEAIEHGVNGYLVPYGNEQALADEIARLVGDAELRGQIGEAAARTFEAKYTAEKMGTRFTDMIEQITNHQWTN